ncbi:hypothetical protein GCM10007938_36390 [Vibrio zhanjiangensis]|uniref:Ion transport domain-containing protein n=1 Tax=Vibrio zhanjiangensis TaxID=1046128 RepID=A0ABQ6F4L6_9VIBR|nr:hypothetical protein [Vibrio zhanjiangensis]GLT19856.1 hypothetical protein GCM10007938_36390 [Vibrio zhanjiangensis]
MITDRAMEAESLDFGPFQFFTLILSIYVLVALLIEGVIAIPSHIAHILSIADNLICLIFLADFFIRFKQAQSKTQFMKWGWIDLLASIPMFDVFRFGKIFRVVTVLHILWAMGSTKMVLYHLFRNKAQGTFSFISSVSVILMIFGAITMIELQKGLY